MFQRIGIVFQRHFRLFTGMEKGSMDLTHSLGEARSGQSASSTGLLTGLPWEALEEIFMNLPPHQLVCVCRLVCCEWKELVDSQSLWRERCRREGYILYDATKVPSDWRLFYFLSTKRHNLLKNPRAEEKLAGWHIVDNGGDGWKVEDPIVPHPDKAIQKVFVTSFCMCRKSQLITLKKEGYGPSFMDHFQPDIAISDWYAPRWDCGSIYEIRVELLDKRKNPVQTFAPDTVIFYRRNDQQWNHISHVFKNYGPGVRYIYFIHGGKDAQFWKGWYGIRVTNSCVEICPSMDR